MECPVPQNTQGSLNPNSLHRPWEGRALLRSSCCFSAGLRLFLPLSPNPSLPTATVGPAEPGGGRKGGLPLLLPTLSPAWTSRQVPVLAADLEGLEPTPQPPPPPPGSLHSWKVLGHTKPKSASLASLLLPPEPSSARWRLRGGQAAHLPRPRAPFGSFSKVKSCLSHHQPWDLRDPGPCISSPG